MIADIALFIVGAAIGYYAEKSGNTVSKVVDWARTKLGKETAK